MTEMDLQDHRWLYTCPKCGSHEGISGKDGNPAICAVCRNKYELDEPAIGEQVRDYTGTKNDLTGDAEVILRTWGGESEMERMVRLRNEALAKGEPEQKDEEPPAEPLPAPGSLSAAREDADPALKSFLERIDSANQGHEQDGALATSEPMTVADTVPAVAPVPTTTDSLLTPDEAAAELGVHPNTVRGRIKKDQYPGMAFNQSEHRYIIPRSAVEAAKQAEIVDEGSPSDEAEA